jgi:hypothetical protein
MGWNVSKSTRPPASAAGDGEVRALLDRYRCPVPFHAVRPRFLGGIAWFAVDSLLEEAVSSEPVSEAKFPASWENTGNFVRLGLRVRLIGSKSIAEFNGLRSNSLLIGTGNLIRPCRELIRAIREFFRLIRESRAGRDFTAR